MTSWSDDLRSWYFQGPRGLRFNWDREPTFECPNADLLDERGERRTRPELVAAARAIGADPLLLGQLLHSRHSLLQARRLRVDGRLTDRCATCGSKMTRKGYRAWIDEPGEGTIVPSGGSEPSSARVARSTIRTTWHRTKTAAEAWARHELTRAMTEIRA